MPDFFSPVFWVTLAMLLLAGWGVLLALGARDIRAMGPRVYAARLSQNDLPPGLDEAGFIRAWWRAKAPRRALHAYVATLIGFALTPLTAIFLDWLWRAVWNLSNRPADLEEGHMLWFFYLALGVAASWIGLVALAVRLYYANPALSLEREIEREVKGA